MRIATASASGIEWLTATNSRSNGPKVIRSPSATTCWTVFLSRCSRSLEPISARVSWEPTSGMSCALAQQVRHGADVVLVAVGQHQRVDVVEAVPDRVEVGQDQVDAGMVLLGEEHPAVDDRAGARRTRRRSCCGRPRRGRRAAMTRRPPRGERAGARTARGGDDSCEQACRHEAGSAAPPPRRRRAGRAGRARAVVEDAEQLEGGLGGGRAVVRHAHDGVDRRQQPGEGRRARRRGRRRGTRRSSRELGRRRRARPRRPGRSRRGPGSPALRRRRRSRRRSRDRQTRGTRARSPVASLTATTLSTAARRS